MKLSWGGWIAVILACLGLAAFGKCVWVALDDEDVDTSVDGCLAGMFPETKSLPTRSTKDEAGKLRVIGVFPAEAEINDSLCVVVAGVATLQEQTEPANAAERARKDLERQRATYDDASATDARRRALAKAIADEAAAATRAARPLPEVDLAVFLNDEPAPFTMRAASVAGPQLRRLRLEASDDAGNAGAKFWRDLLRGAATESDPGKLPVVVGVSRTSASTTPEASAPTAFTMRVFGMEALGWGVASLGLLVLSFAMFAWSTTLLRDNKLSKRWLGARKVELDAVVSNAAAAQPDKDAAKAEIAEIDRLLALHPNTDESKPLGSFSLGRTQMAVWFFLVIAGFLFISMTLGQYLNLISPNILVLLGISGATGLAAIQITGDKAGYRTSRHFVYDILCDADGPQLQRIQAVAWTLVMGGIFTLVAIRDFRFVQFDTNLLLLMGIASSLYLGFKFQEK